MKKKIAVWSIAILLPALLFVFGLGVGFYRIPPFSTLERAWQFVKPEWPVRFNDAAFNRMPELQGVGPKEIDALLHVRTKADAAQIRSDLIQYIWKRPVLPTGEQPTNVAKDVKTPPVGNYDNLQRVDKLTVELEHGYKSNAFHFIPEKSNNQLILYHQGHSFILTLRSQKAINNFLAAGFAVIAFAMPQLGFNEEIPIVDLPHIGQIKISSHDEMRWMESDTFAPIKLFVHPVLAAINYAEQKYRYKNITMTGISGGGWTTTLYAALDPRVKFSFPVAGSLPFYLRKLPPIPTWGDFEQIHPPLYKIANYLDLYVLGSFDAGRQQVQILNQYDSCCFAGIGAKSYSDIVANRVDTIAAGGGYRLVLDATHNQHDISDFALKTITEIATK